MKSQLLFLLVAIFLFSCKTQTQSVLVSSHYNEEMDRTDYSRIPYGSVSIPGEWKQTTFNDISKQQIFKNRDSVFIAIGLTPTNKYEFNTDGSKNNFDFVSAFYEWERKYFTEDLGLSVEKLESNIEDNYIIFRVYGNKIDSFFLFGEKNGISRNYSVSITDKWTKDTKIEFLKKLYLKEKTE